jgi:hypothetical protein
MIERLETTPAALREAAAAALAAVPPPLSSSHGGDEAIHTATRRPHIRQRPEPTSPNREERKPHGAADMIRLFVSYSHKDERHRKALEVHLASARRGGRAIEWNDRLIHPGTEWADAIDAELNRADVVVLLLSPDFLASDYCYGVEMERALERHRAGDARVVPVVVRPCDWKYEPIQELQMLPTGAKPVTEWPNRDRAWLDVATGIRAVIAELSVDGASNRGT